MVAVPSKLEWTIVLVIRPNCFYCFYGNEAYWKIDSLQILQWKGRHDSGHERMTREFNEQIKRKQITKSLLFEVSSLKS